MAGGETRREVAPEVAKLQLAVDDGNGMIVALTLTDQDANDPSLMAPPPDHVDGRRIARETADEVYDGTPTYVPIAERGDDIEVAIPPRSTALPLR